VEAMVPFPSPLARNPPTEGSGGGDRRKPPRGPGAAPLASRFREAETWLASHLIPLVLDWAVGIKKFRFCLSTRRDGIDIEARGFHPLRTLKFFFPTVLNVWRSV
jgi:hypothetical protein